MDKLSIRLKFRANYLYFHLCKLMIVLRAEKMALYFADKWVQSFKIKTGNDDWKYLNLDVVAVMRDKG